MACAMKKLATALLFTVSLTFTACGQLGDQWINPDVTFSKLDQPSVKGINDTQEDMAKEAVAAGDYQRAAEFYQQLVATKNGTPEQQLRYKMGLAEAVRRLGKNENALELYDQLFKENPNNLDVAEGRALTLMANGKTADAGRAFQAVLDKDPKRWRTLNALGILFVTKDMIPEAMAYYNAALDQSPDNAAILNNVGLSQAIDHKYSRGIEALQQASRVSKSPSQRKQIELNMAMVYGVSGDLDNARDVAEKYLEGPALDNNLGLYAHLAKDDGLAKSYLNMALSQSSTYYERAWENLDVVSDNGHGGNDAEVATPIVQASPEKPAADVKHKPHKTAHNKVDDGEVTQQSTMKADDLPIVTVEPKADDAPDSKADAKPAAPAKAEDKKTDDKPAAKTDDKSDKKDDKPAGLIVTPGE